jgi:hypothetical protein
MQTRRIAWVGPIVVTALCYIIYNPPVHIAMIRMFS